MLVLGVSLSPYCFCATHVTLCTSTSSNRHAYSCLHNMQWLMLQGFPSSGSGFIAAMAFHGGIASILGLYTLFWLKLNLMQTLPILLVLGLFTTVAGYNALSRQAEARLKQV